MTTTVSLDRASAIDEIVTHLVPRASQLTRLLLSTGSRTLSRAEGGLLSTLQTGPKRITDLAVSEVLAQPTVTQLVDRLQKRGFAERSRDERDGRVVLVSITPTGEEALDEMRSEYRAKLRAAVGDLPEAELSALASATATLVHLIVAAQDRRL